MTALRETIKSGDRVYEVDFLDVDGAGYTTSYKLIAIEHVVEKVTPTTVVLKTSRYGTTPARHGLTKRVGRVTIGGRYQATEREAWLAYIKTQKSEIEARERELARHKDRLETAYLELGKVVTK